MKPRIDGKRRRVARWLTAGLLVVALWASTWGIAVTDRAFVCETTGSRKGDREWFFGAHTNSWYRKSELERFMEVAHPNLLRHRWTRFRGDGRSLIPFRVSRGHGRPGPILLVEVERLDEHVSSLSDTQRLELYQTFSGESPDAIRLKIDAIIEAGLGAGD